MYALQRGPESLSLSSSLDVSLLVDGRHLTQFPPPINVGDTVHLQVDLGTESVDVLTFTWTREDGLSLSHVGDGPSFNYTARPEDAGDALSVDCTVRGPLGVVVLYHIIAVNEVEVPFEPATPTHIPVAPTSWTATRTQRPAAAGSAWTLSTAQARLVGIVVGCAALAILLAAAAPVVRARRRRRVEAGKSRSAGGSVVGTSAFTLAGSLSVVVGTQPDGEADLDAGSTGALAISGQHLSRRTLGGRTPGRAERAPPLVSRLATSEFW